MALDQIWKQQLALVTYGNEYLQHDLNFSQWLQHPIFAQHSFLFRDLLSQHLLAQHFQIWLEYLKKQGVKQLSLHLSSALNEEKNPNANVELLPFSHFIVSHHPNQKFAWIFGHELAEWYTSDNEFEAPLAQRITLRQEVFWRFELNDKLIKKIEADLKAPKWQEISDFMDSELFHNKYVVGFEEPDVQDKPFYGIELSTLGEEPALTLIPARYPAEYAHQLLHRTQALSAFLEQKKRLANDPLAEQLDAEQHINLRNFSQKTDDLTAKLIVKAANHYQSAQRVAKVQASPLDPTHDTPSHFTHATHKGSGSGVWKLILLTIIICALAYYFGL